MPTVIIYVPYFWLVERLGPHDLNRIRETSKAKISNALVLESYRENAVWNDFKKSLLQNIAFEKETRLLKLGKLPKVGTLKVAIDAKTHALARLARAPASIGVRTSKPSKQGTSKPRLPPISKSMVRLNFR